MSSKLFGDHAYIIKLCGQDDVTPLIVELNHIEKILMDYLHELSEEISKSQCQPTLDIEKFPSDEYYKKQLDEDDMQYYDELVKQHIAAFEKIRERLDEKKANKTPKTTK